MKIIEAYTREQIAEKIVTEDEIRTIMPPNAIRYNQNYFFTRSADNSFVDENSGYEAIVEAMSHLINVKAPESNFSYLLKASLLNNKPVVLSISCDGKRVYPSINGTVETSLAPELSNILGANGYDFHSVRQQQLNQDALEENRYQAILQTADDVFARANAAGYIASRAIVKIEGKKARVTNWHRGYTLIMRDKDKAQEIIRALGTFTGITNEDMSNLRSKSGFKLTQRQEVYNVLKNLGIADFFLDAEQKIRTGQIIETSLVDFRDKVLEHLLSDEVALQKVKDEGIGDEEAAEFIREMFDAGFQGEIITNASIRQKFIKKALLSGKFYSPDALKTKRSIFRTGVHF